jgi:hypothetical protein
MLTRHPADGAPFIPAKRGELSSLIEEVDRLTA